MAIYRSAREEERVRQGRRSYHKGAGWPDLVARSWQGPGACPQVTATVGYPSGQPSGWLTLTDHGSGGKQVVARSSRSLLRCRPAGTGTTSSVLLAAAYDVGLAQDDIRLWATSTAWCVLEARTRQHAMGAFGFFGGESGIRTHEHP